MPRRAYPSPSLSAAVRQHFGLTQAELARFMGLSREHLANVEAGRKAFSEGPRRRLWVLARHLPPPDGQGPPAPAFAAPAPFALVAADAPPLRARLRRCRFRLVQLRFELGQLAPLSQQHARRHWAVAVLRAALAAPAAGEAPVPGRLAYPDATPDPVRDAAWLDRLAADNAAAPVPLAPAAHALLLARLRGLEAEVAALEGWLAGLQP